LPDLAPRCVADCAGDIDLELQDRHGNRIHHRVTEDTQEIKSSILMAGLHLASKILFDLCLCTSVVN
jgi:hypothetical protein